MLMQARTTVPLTSISQAPQLPPRQPVGIETPARLALSNQSVPTVSVVRRPFGQRTWMVLMTSRGGEKGGEIHMLLEGVGQAIQQLLAMHAVMGLIE